MGEQSTNTGSVGEKHEGRSQREMISARRGKWTDEHARALILPLAGLLGVVVLAILGACTRISETVLTAGITAVVTLTASAGGHAAGLAKASRGYEEPSIDGSQ